MRHKLLVLTALLSLGVAGLTVANAATLGVDGGSVTAVQGDPCTTETIDVTRTQPVYFWIFLIGYEGVRLTDIPATCWNQPISITAGNNDATGTSSGATSGTLEIDMNDRYATNTSVFHLVINGWAVPAVRIG